MPHPTSKTELRRMMGMANYLDRFVPHMAEVLQPLSSMMSSRQDVVWGPAQEAAFKKWKTLLSSDPVLRIYDSNMETVVTADASSNGLGAVLRQRQKDGRDLTVADALSRSPLPQTESLELEDEIQGYLRLVTSSVPVIEPTLQLIAQEQEQDPTKPTEKRILPRRAAHGEATVHGPAHVQRKPPASDTRLTRNDSFREVAVSAPEERLRPKPRNGKPEKSQVDALVYLMGPQAEDIFKTFKLEPGDQKFEVVLQEYEADFVPRWNIIYERVKFNTLTQQDGESVEDFVTALHALASTCDYGELREDLIRDRLVVGSSRP
ncbi:uncharacterized protein LOC142568632 [Dermacentor variabilis]|uniref:uncharacterized protein LOC142568632 n=1 Tax=Dermacentor variabilis TaxID=34621 RepID=UPI003F5B4666